MKPDAAEEFTQLVETLKGYRSKRRKALVLVNPKIFRAMEAAETTIDCIVIRPGIGWLQGFPVVSDPSAPVWTISGKPRHTVRQ